MPKYNIPWNDLNPDEGYSEFMGCQEFSCHGCCEYCEERDNTCKDYPKQCHLCTPDCKDKEKCIEEKIYEGCCRTCASQKAWGIDPMLETDDDFNKGCD